MPFVLPEPPEALSSHPACPSPKDLPPAASPHPKCTRRAWEASPFARPALFLPASVHYGQAALQAENKRGLSGHPSSKTQHCSKPSINHLRPVLDVPGAIRKAKQKLNITPTMHSAISNRGNLNPASTMPFLRALLNS